MRFKTKKQDREQRKTDYSVINNDSNVDNIYYTLTIKNNNTGYGPDGKPTGVTEPAVSCKFVQNREEYYIDNPSKYNVTIPYFHLDSNSFPLQVVQPQVGQYYSPKQSTASYSIQGFPTVFGGLIYDPANAVYYPFTVYWLSENKTLQTPASPIVRADLTNEYFYNYSYNYFLSLLNNSIGYCRELNNIFIGSSISFFSYDDNTELFTFNAGIPNFFNVRYLLNSNLYQLFAGLPFIRYIDISGIYYYDIVIENLNDTYIMPSLLTNVPLDSANISNFCRVTQNYPSVEVWDPVISIVFMARNLDVLAQIKGQPYIFGVNPNPPSNNADVSPVLFELFLGRRNNPTIDYQSQGEYLLTNLLGITAQSELQIDTYWKDVYGNLNLFYIEAGSSLIIKLLFRNKVFNY